jgi:hypothetical protein
MNNVKLKYSNSTPLPHNFLAEQAILNILLTNSTAFLIQEVLSNLKIESFYFEPHKLIYETIFELSEKNIPVNLANVINNLQDKEIINKYIIVIQYLNSIYKLEKNIKNTRIAYLRDERNYSCHYVLDDDDNFIKLKKNEYILEKLTTIDESIKNKIEKKYGKDIIQKIISVVKPLVEIDKQVIVDNTGFTQEQIDDEISFFWDF